ncbi:hypothetical protein BJ875DRAFT_77825 [Amylocarpus encephaloides]|uniref:Uncharacterized protein n=1 Tax=Amylocarpus encephaloides TaxID=45428 RepID=A0A9P8C3G7_9HELO|nr:hypothetical protein BJ875DRAFT_77825 [Amylocarpus encephaloides]
MHFSTLSTVILAATPLAFSATIPQVIPRGENRIEDRIDEAVFLVRCNKFVVGNDQSSSGTMDKLFYYKDYKDFTDNKDQNAESYVSGGTGSGNMRIKWEEASAEKPIKGDLDDMPFEVWGLDPKGDKETHVTGRATLDRADMRCYDNAGASWKQDYGPKMYIMCSANYYCTRSNRLIRRTWVEVRETIEKVEMTGEATHGVKGPDLTIQYDIRSAFKNLRAFHDKKEADGKLYTIGQFGSHDIKFTVSRQEKPGDPYWEEDRISLISDDLAERLSKTLWEKAEQGECKAWFVDRMQRGKCKHVVPFPKEIIVRVQTADQQTLDWDDRDVVTITVQPKDKGSCKSDKVLGGILGGLFKVGAAAATGGASAALTGLGLIAGQAVSGTCG